MQYFGEEKIARKITFIPTDVVVCFIHKIFVAIIYTLVSKIIIIVSLFHLICLFSLD